MALLRSDQWTDFGGTRQADRRAPSRAAGRYSSVVTGPYRRRRRPNRTGDFAKGTRALSGKSERRRGEKSLLLRNGRHAPPSARATVLPHLRSRRIISRGSSGSRQRPQFARDRQFRQRHTVCEELQQRYGFQTDDGRPLCDGGDEDVLQRLLPRLGGKIRRLEPLLRAV